MGLESYAGRMLQRADVTINGHHPWDIQVSPKNLPEFLRRAFWKGTLGVGEAYMDGVWTTRDLAELSCRISSSPVQYELNGIYGVLHAMRSILLNLQTRVRSFTVGKRHYDLGNDFFERMLGPSMAYTCAYWETGANNLTDAQIAKFDLVCRKLGFKKGDHILDIGCGWGAFLKYAAEYYGVTGVGVSVSQEQIEYAKKFCEGVEGLTFHYEDYRQTTGTFDHVVSIGMYEQVGPKNSRTFMRKVRELLRPGGLFLLHTISTNRLKGSADVWLHKYIFPNGVLPSQKELGHAIGGIFVLEHEHNIGYNYYQTLLAWYKNFCDAWPEFYEKYGERFFRMWEFYLLTCAGMFKARRTQVVQCVLSPKGVAGGYKSIR